MFCVFFGKKHAAFKCKDAISGFPVSSGSAEAIFRWGGKITHVLIAYFLGNIFAKNCCNRTVYVKIIASQRWDVFLRHSIIDTVLECHSPFQDCLTQKCITNNTATVCSETSYHLWNCNTSVPHRLSLVCTVGDGHHYSTDISAWLDSSCYYFSVICYNINIPAVWICQSVVPVSHETLKFPEENSPGLEPLVYMI